ncbi:hypothetical protein HK096_001313, partial [Nowakowskiella sp. JEL0078]
MKSIQHQHLMNRSKFCHTLTADQPGFDPVADRLVYQKLYQEALVSLNYSSINSN